MSKNMGKSALRSAFHSWKLSGTLSLSLLFAGCAGTPSQPDMSFIEQQPDNYPTQTHHSQMLDAIENAANAYKPEHNTHLLDIDGLNLMQAHHKAGDPSVLTSYFYGLGISFGRDVYSSLDRRVGNQFDPSGMSAGAYHMGKNSGRFKLLDSSEHDQACVIIPERIDASSLTLIDDMIKNAHETLTLSKENPGAYAIFLRNSWHETWHCLDEDYVTKRHHADTNNGPEFGYATHKAEVFADVAAGLTMKALGYKNVSRQYADVRAIRSSTFGTFLTTIYVREYDYQYFGGSNYYTTRALDLAAQDTTVPKASSPAELDMAAIHKAAIRITEAGLLQPKEYFGLNEFLANGEQYIQELEKQDDQDMLAFINAYKDRVAKAENRLSNRTDISYERYEDNFPPSAFEIYNKASEEEKQEIFNAVWHKYSALKKRGVDNATDIAVIQVLDEWREELHNSERRRPDLERKLLVASLMIRFKVVNFENHPAYSSAKTDISKKISPYIQ